MSPEEYAERSAFADEMKRMSKSEFIEIARILHQHNIAVSENRSGLFFDMREIPREVFEALLKFRQFVAQNNAVLAQGREPSKAIDPLEE
jgi:hypothetical protein